MNRKRLIYLALIVPTLAIGIIVGTIVSGGVRATSEQKPATIAIPDPVAISNSFSHIAEMLEPAVVNINVEIPPAPRVSRGGRPGGGRGGNGGAAPDPNDPLGGLFGGLFGNGGPSNADAQPEEAEGTGFIVDKGGYILTNEHVVKDATKITVTLSDKSKLPAKLIGTDCYTDLAVIKVDAGKDLQIAKFGNSDAVKTGDWVLAVGSPFGFDHTVTSGIISAKGRSADELSGNAPRTGKCEGFQSFLQTDAAINPGNSGGPLVNMLGEVIGINTAIVSETNSFAGLGFSLPSNIAIKVYNQLAQNGKITRGSIGITYNASPDADLLRAFGVKEGVVVQDVLSGKPAAQAGIKPGDVITSIDGQRITSPPMLLDIIASSPVNHSIQMKVMRDGKEQVIPVLIGDRERVVNGGEAAANSAPDIAPPLPANPPDRVLGITVQPVPQNIVKKYAMSGVAMNVISKGSVAAEVFGVRPDPANPSYPPYVLDQVFVDGNKTEIRTPADFERAVASLKRGTKVALGVFHPTQPTQSDYKYEHSYFALTMP